MGPGGEFGDGLFFAVFAGVTTDAAGFVDFFTKFVDQVGTVEGFGFGEINKGEMGGFEEFLEVFWGDVEGVTGGFFDGFFGGVGEFDGADGTEGTFVTEDEVDVFVLDEAFGGLAVLGTDFVVEEGGDFDLGDDVEFFTKEFDEELKAEFFGAFHKAFTGAIAGAGLETLAALTHTNAGENGHEKQGHDSDSCGSQVDFIGAEEFFNVHVNKPYICHLL